MSQKAGDEHVGTRTVNGVTVDIYGCWDKETPENQYDFYDLYVDGECINLGEPCYKKPTNDDIRAFLELQEALKD
jgi:hypothetical protein